MSAVVRPTGTVQTRDRAREPDVNVTERDVADPAWMVRTLVRLMRDLADLRRRWLPRRLTFRDREVPGDGTTKIRLPHAIRGDVEYTVTRWQSGGAGPPHLEVHSDTDAHTLVLVSYEAGTATIRIEEAG
ncbi:MAG: hypothetical protein KIS78_38100 [Labilithrix sp.]|nr:hypothetical protein [Labilithrix sp.]